MSVPTPSVSEELGINLYSFLPMRKTLFLKFIVIFVIGLSFFAFVRSVCDDDDSAYDILGRNNDISPYDKLLADALSLKDIFYEYRNDVIYSEPIISYFARQEKSPPAVMPVAIF